MWLILADPCLAGIDLKGQKDENENIIDSDFGNLSSQKHTR
jgi:hypothetical protein